MFSRRELLQGVFGAAAGGLSACSRRTYPGSFRGASHAAGHRLRDATPERGSGPERRVRVAIVGGGPSGLTAAWALERAAERDFRIFELEPQAGGTSAFGTDGVVPHPWGAHYLPVPHGDQPELIALLDELGALEPRARPQDAPRGREEALVREPEERVFADGEWHEGLFPRAVAGPTELDELARFEAEVSRWVRYRDSRGRRAFALPLRACSDDAEVTALDAESAATWLDARGLRSPALRWWIEYACRDDYGLDLAGTSAWAMLFYFASRREAAGGASAPFLTWPEGNGRLVQHLARAAGDRLRLGSLVTDVVPDADGASLAVVDVATGALERWRAEYVVLATPKYVAPRILRPWREARPAHLDAFRYGSWLVANLHLRERPASRGFPFAWDNVLYDSPSLGYVVATHQRLADRGPTVWTYYLPLVEEDQDSARRKLLALEHGEAVAAIVADLAPAHVGLERALDRVDLWRWGHAMISPVPGFVWGPARRKAAAPLGRVGFASTDLSGVALFEEAFDHGLRAAGEALSVLRGAGRPG